MTSYQSQAQTDDPKQSRSNQPPAGEHLGLDRPNAEEATGNPQNWRWKYRPLIIFTETAPDDASRPAHEQIRKVAAVREGFVERDMILVVIRTGKSQSTLQGEPISQEAAEEIRRQFFAESQPFEVILVGKDGGVKLRRGEPVDMEDVFQLIDSMPMRQREMRE